MPAAKGRLKQLLFKTGNKSDVAGCNGNRLPGPIVQFNYYFNNSLSTGQTAVNKNLDFTKAHHFVLSYDWNISDLVHFKMEPYYQQLYSVPVIANSSFSFLNLAPTGNKSSEWFYGRKSVTHLLPISATPATARLFQNQPYTDTPFRLYRYTVVCSSLAPTAILSRTSTAHGF